MGDRRWEWGFLTTGFWLLFSVFRFQRFRFPLFSIFISSFCFLLFAFLAQPQGRQPERQETGDENRDTGGIMPSGDCRNSLPGRDPREQGRPRHVEQERKREPGKDTGGTPRHVQPVKLSEEKRDQMRRVLRRAAANLRSSSGSFCASAAMRASRIPLSSKLVRTRWRRKRPATLRSSATAS